MASLFSAMKKNSFINCFLLFQYSNKFSSPLFLNSADCLTVCMNFLLKTSVLLMLSRFLICTSRVTSIGGIWYCSPNLCASAGLTTIILHLNGSSLILSRWKVSTVPSNSFLSVLFRFFIIFFINYNCILSLLIFSAKSKNFLIFF